MNAQTIFDTVVKGLYAQGRPSMRLNSNPDALSRYVCAYRGVDNTKCAVGFLIPDEAYRPFMDLENLDVAALDRSNHLPDHLKPHVEMLEVLQGVHDSQVVRLSDPETKKPVGFNYDVLHECLMEVVQQYDLDPATLNNLNKEHASHVAQS